MDQPLEHPTVDDLVMEYLHGTEVGQLPDVETLAARLPDEGSRRELRALVETTEWAKKAFPAPFRPRAVIAERYVLLEELGSGGFGKVWRATDQRLGRDVALKLFHPLMDEQALESTLRRERDSLARVNHDGIVRLVDSGRHEDTFYLAMEFVPGTTLDKVLAALAARPERARPDRAAVATAIGGSPAVGAESLIENDWYRTATNITIAILRALAAAHGHGITHRDLKPGNILLRPGGRPVVLDFGLAGLADLAAGTLTGRLFGTIAYMAPEQVGSMRTGKDVRVDVYQCGLLLYEMLTFRRAFVAEERADLLEAVRAGIIVSPRQVRRDIPAELADVCLRALERNPEHRYATADAFRDDLERWLAGHMPAAARLGVAGRAWRRVRNVAVRHRWAVLGACLLVVSAGSTAWLALRPGPIHALSREDGQFDVTTRDSGMVCAWLMSLDAEGALCGTYPLRLQVGASKPQMQVLLPGGTTTVRTHEVADFYPMPGATHTKVRWFVAADDMADDWRQLALSVAADANRMQQPVTPARVRELDEELRTPGRGGRVIGKLPLDELLR